MVMMTKCKGCGAVISDTAMSCPQCGHQHRRPRKGFFDGCGMAIVILLLLLIVIWLFGGTFLAAISGV